MFSDYEDEISKENFYLKRLMKVTWIYSKENV